MSAGGEEEETNQIRAGTSIVAQSEVVVVVVVTEYLVKEILSVCYLGGREDPIGRPAESCGNWLMVLLLSPRNQRSRVEERIFF